MAPEAEGARYAHGRRLLRESLAGFLPPARIGVADNAVARRWLANEGGYVGRWQHSEAPYMVAPMEALTDPDHDTVAIVGPGQAAKTSAAENWLLAAVPNDPADMLWYMQTDAGVEAYVKSRINPMIEAHRDDLYRLLGPRPVDDSLHYKRFRGMTVEFLSATHSNLINKKAGRIVADEIDAYPEGLGDVKVMLDVRRRTFFSSMLLALSHPDRATGLDPERDWTAGIMAFYRDSDRRIFWWPCPHCGAWSSPAPTAARVMVLHWDAEGDLDKVEASARLVCPVSGCLIEDKDRRAMLQAGRWIAAGEEIAEDGTVSGQRIKRKTAGFWIVGTMSLLIRGGIGELARAQAKAEREFEASGDDVSLRQVMVKSLGVPYQPPRGLGAIDAGVLVGRVEAELAIGKVANGVRFLTAAFDVQAAHFELLVRGWGEGGESWIVEHQRIAKLDERSIEPATDPRSWDAMLAWLLERRYPLADNSGRVMAIRGIGFDSGGLPGVTHQAYSAWRRLRAAHRARLLSRAEGRDVWSVIPMKGASPLAAAKLSVVYPDSARKDRAVARTGTVPLALFNANAFKDDLAGQLGRGLPGPGYVHFPLPLKGDGPPHLFFEQLCAEKRDTAGRWARAHHGVRNEVLDLHVMTHVLAHLHGLAGIKWDRPPAWAAPWDVNPMVSAGGAPATPVAGAPAPTGLPAPSPAPARRSILDKLLPR